jgi:hypothetical protein
LIDWEDIPRWQLVCDALGLPFHEPAETYSTSEHLYLELDIPTDAGSVLPRTARTRAGLSAEQLEDLGGPDAKGRRPGRPERAERSERPARPVRARVRRRTRAGQPIEGSDSAAASEAGLAPETIDQPGRGPTPDTAE